MPRALSSSVLASASTREPGYRPTPAPDPAAPRLAAIAGLGRLNAQGNLVTKKLGTKVHVGDVIRTDLPLAADG